MGGGSAKQCRIKSRCALVEPRCARYWTGVYRQTERLPAAYSLPTAKISSTVDYAATTFVARAQLVIREVEDLLSA